MQGVATGGEGLCVDPVSIDASRVAVNSMVDFKRLHLARISNDDGGAIVRRVFYITSRERKYGELTAT